MGEISFVFKVSSLDPYIRLIHTLTLGVREKIWSASNLAPDGRFKIAADE